MNRIPDEQLRSIAEQERERVMRITDRKQWPHCHRVSLSICEKVHQKCFNENIEDISTKIFSYKINGEYQHFAAVITDRKTGEKRLIDASYTQFAHETDTPIGVAPLDNIDDIVIVDPKEYIFMQENTTKIENPV